MLYMSFIPGADMGILVSEVGKVFLASDILGISLEAFGSWNEICSMVKNMHFFIWHVMVLS